ncbi:hypothetical protein Mgra_00009396 [Meloidogyne graminicola]|uniref:Homeobox domain-containing protein n=1 Tax=Meloidogyne graminicola TaxID=189291 RepID=A0A8S9ZDC0_9BILA|nr:hypothetical protein Mgra_00009396 [Meloidogyne graminicola]
MSNGKSNDKNGIANFINSSLPSSHNLVQSVNDGQPKAENYFENEEENLKSVLSPSSSSVSKKSSIFGFSIVDLLAINGSSCNKNRRNSETTIFSRKKHKDLEESDEPPMKKIFKSEGYEGNLENQKQSKNEYLQALQRADHSDQTTTLNLSGALMFQYPQQFIQNNYKENKLDLNLREELNLATVSASTQQNSEIQNQQQHVERTIATEIMKNMLARPEILTSTDSKQILELKKMSSTSITLPPSLINLSNLLLTQNQMTDSNNLSAEKMLQLLATNRKHEQHAYSPGQLNNPFFGLLMDAQQQHFISFLTRMKGDNGERELSPTASGQNSLNDESPVGEESDEGDDFHECSDARTKITLTSDEEPTSSSNHIMPAIKSYSTKNEAGIRKKKTRTVFSRGQVGLLEASFNVNKYLTSQQRTELAKSLSLTETQRVDGIQHNCGGQGDYMNTTISSLQQIPNFTIQQHQNFQQNNILNISPTCTSESPGHSQYEQFSSTNQKQTQQQLADFKQFLMLPLSRSNEPDHRSSNAIDNNDANNSNPLLSENSSENASTIMLQQARFLVSFLTSSTTSQLPNVSPSMLPSSFNENGKDISSNNFNSSSTSILPSTTFIPETFTSP